MTLRACSRARVSARVLSFRSCGGFIEVDEDFDDVFADEDLGEDEAEAGFVGALFVDGLCAGHAESHDNVALLGVEENLAGGWEVFDAGDGAPDDLEAGVAGVEFVDGGGCHVDAGEGGVNDADALHGLRSPSFFVGIRGLR